MSEEFTPDAMGRLYVMEGPEMPHPGKVHPVLPAALGYALGQGYRQCAKPAEPGAPPPPVATVAPEPVKRGPKPKKTEAASA